MSAAPPSAVTSCDYCGLPAYAAAESSGPHYCCSGCRFAASLTANSGEAGESRSTMVRLGVAIFFFMNVMVFTLVLWSQPNVALDPAANAWYGLARYAALLFSLPVVFLLAGPLMSDAGDELRRGRASLNLLLLLGIVSALGYSLYSVFSGSGHVYFEVACTILVAVTLGRWLEANGKLQTTAALRELKQLLPETVRLIESDEVRLAPTSALRAGDTYRVLPGERIAADGVVARREAAVDEQTITGESLPVLRRPGDVVLSGTIVLDGPLEITATAPAGEGMLARMIEAVSQATATRTRFERLAERLSRVFLPLVAFAACATLALHAWNGQFADGLLAALAVLVIACPCALGLATPMALWAAVGRAAQAGVLIRHGDSFSLLANARTVGFDKTGTLTTGITQVTEVDLDPLVCADDVWPLALALAQCSNHPLAAAAANYAGKRLGCGGTPVLKNVRVQPGRGIMADLAASAGKVYLGSQRWLAECGQFPRPTSHFPPEADEHASTCLAAGGEILCRFQMRESIRPEASRALGELRSLGLAPCILTGDRARRAEALARLLNIDFHAELLPEAKLAAIEAWKAAGPVVMVGDGVNDAPALAAASVGIALGSGADISRHSAGVCLLANDLTRLPWLVRLARQTVRTIRWNLFWAFAYNIAGVGLAFCGWLHPVFAALAMGASSVLVVSHSLVLSRFPLVQEDALRQPEFPHDERPAALNSSHAARDAVLGAAP